MEKGDKAQCCRCGKVFGDYRFFKVNCGVYSNIGYIPFCKDCIVELFEKYKNEYQDELKAMQRVCMICDLYYDADLFVAVKGNRTSSTIGEYMKRINLQQYKGLDYDSTIANALKHAAKTENSSEDVDQRIVEKWGYGLEPTDYNVLEDHYKQIKAANPKCDSNQEIFIMDLCYTKMQQMRALRDGNASDYTKMTDSYRKTFDQAGLKTIDESATNTDDSWGVWQARIAQYTPEEYYKNKKLYKDFDGIGDYMERFILRPLRNLMFGTQDRDPEFCVHDDTEENDDVDSDTEDTL